MAFVACVLLLGACAEPETTDSASTQDSVAVVGTVDSMTIEAVLRTDRRFSRLVTALDSTGLDTVLAGTGPFTLFAPPNAAFEDLPNGTMASLLTDRRGRLRTILAHHVVGGRMPAAALADTTKLTMLSGDTLRVRTTDTTLSVGPARVLEDGVEGANGVIHVIDRMLPPPPDDR